MLFFVDGSLTRYVCLMRRDGNTLLAGERHADRAFMLTIYLWIWRPGRPTPAVHYPYEGARDATLCQRLVLAVLKHEICGHRCQHSNISAPLFAKLAETLQKQPNRLLIPLAQSLARPISIATDQTHPRLIPSKARHQDPPAARSIPLQLAAPPRPLSAIACV